MYPQSIPAQVKSWSENIVEAPLAIRLEWASPDGTGPFPAVLVHPDRDGTALDMRGVIWDLACRGYLAVAADYQRLERGRYRRTLFPWRGDDDVTRVLERLRSHPQADARRLAALGFSQGGILSLLIAARVPELKAVVAYYPVTDLNHWFNYPHPNLARRFVFRLIRRFFFKQSGARDEAEFQAILRRASPYAQAAHMAAPVLLIHGTADTSAPIEESRRLAARLSALGRVVDLLEVEGGRHVFNFKEPEQAALAWRASLRWLHRHLGVTSAPGPSACGGCREERPSEDEGGLGSATSSGGRPWTGR
ncbi:MAG TPA: prolyl oligopeptidase family serine peptidase [Candidatus Entotheonella sp.]